MSISEAENRALIERYRDEKRYNGSCVGPLVCIDNLGRHYDPERVRAQLSQLLSGVVDVRFAEAHFAGRCVLLGWCCVEFVSAEAAARAIREIDHIYLRQQGASNLLRPLVPHFPDSVKPVDLRRGDSSAMALHLGQSDTVDRESREFVRLDQVLERTKQSIIGRAKQQLLSPLKQLRTSDMSGSRCSAAAGGMGSPGVLLLKNVPESVTDEILLTFMDCFDPEVAIYRILDPVSQQNSPHVIATVSSEQKATFLCEDIQTHLLICDGFRPITATLFDPDRHAGFESLFDQALMEIGITTEHGIVSTELVVLKTPVLDCEKLAVRIRSVMDSMQHYRSYYKKLKKEQQKALYDHIVSEIEQVHDRYTELCDLIELAEQLL